MKTLGFTPTGKFAEVSITGHYCPLNCPMCRGKWLKGMTPAISPDDLVRLGHKLRKKGVEGILISGGLGPDGKLPMRPFVSAIRELKEMGFFISVHTGVVGKEEAKLLSTARVDLADYELILDEGAIKTAKSLTLTPDDFVRGMELLIESSIEVVPHITVGLPGSRENWFEEAANVIRELGIRRSVVLVFIPTPGTPFEDHDPPSPIRVIEVVRLLSRYSKVSLGCMRPPWMKKRLDSALNGLVDRIANPHPSLGLDIVHACCSIPEEVVERFV